jgi:hypothetical protein
LKDFSAGISIITMLNISQDFWFLRDIGESFGAKRWIVSFLTC